MKKSKKLLVGGALSLLLIGIFVGVSQHSVLGKKEDSDKEIEAAKDTVRKIYTESYQEEVDQRLEQVKDSGEYTEEHMLIEPNPYGTNTLSLYVYFKTEVPATVSYTVSVLEEDISDFQVTPAQETSPGTMHEFQVIGLVPEQKNTVTFTVTEEDGGSKEYEYTYKMGRLAGNEEIKLRQTKQSSGEEELDPGLYTILGNDSDGLDFMYYYDNEGTIRGEIPLIGYRSHRLLFQDGRMYYSISQTKIAAVDQLGKVERIYDTGDYILHHDYALDEDGNLLVLATDSSSESVEDKLIKIDTQSGEVSCILDLADLFGDYKEICKKNTDGELDWMHINTLQYLGNGELILSSRETSTILKIKDLYTAPQVEYMIGEKSFWEGTGYGGLLLEKDESGGTFSNTGGQHTVTYVQEDGMPEGQYVLYMFNNNLGVSESRPDYDWSQIEGIALDPEEGEQSYFYKYLVDETAGTYTLMRSFPVPFSGYVSSVQEYGEHVVADSGMQGIFGEYDADGNLLAEYQMELEKGFIYRVYKYDFAGYYCADGSTIQLK